MRKTTTVLFALGLAVVLAGSASATVFYSESFTYPDGALGAAPVGTVNPVTGWLTHSSTLGGSATDIQIVSGVAIANLNTGAPDDSRPFSPGFATVTGPSDVTYSCMMLMIPSTGAALTTGPTYIAHFKDNIPTGTTFTAKLFVGGIAGNATDYNLGISNGPVNTPVLYPTTLQVGTWYVVATRFDATSGVATLWVNPADETSLSVSGTDTGAAGRGLAAYGLRQTSANFTYEIDNLAVGTTFGETCGGQPTPSLGSTWGRIKTMYR